MTVSDSSIWETESRCHVAECYMPYLTSSFTLPIVVKNATLDKQGPEQIKSYQNSVKEHHGITITLYFTKQL